MFAISLLMEMEIIRSVFFTFRYYRNTHTTVPVDEVSLLSFSEIERNTVCKQMNIRDADGDGNNLKCLFHF